MTTEELPQFKLPTNANHCEVCPRINDIHKPNNPQVERTAQQIILAECVKEKFALPARQELVTDGDSIRSNHRLAQCRNCADYIIKGACMGASVSLVNNEPVFYAKASSPRTGQHLKSVKNV